MTSVTFDLSLKSVFVLLLVARVSTKNFTIGFLIPWLEDVEFSGYTSASAVDMAMEFVNSNAMYNAQEEINLNRLVMRDSACSSKLSLGYAVDLIFNQSVDAIIGPPCSDACRSVAELAAEFNVPVISWVATAADLNDKDTFSTLSRTLAPFSKTGLFLLRCLEIFGWKRIALITLDDLIWVEAAVAIEKVLTENNITIAYNVKYARDPTDASLVSILKGVQNEARIVVVISPQASRRRIMLAAYDLSMTNGSYVYFTVDALPQTGVVNIWKGDDGRNWDARRAFEAVFHISLSSLREEVINDFGIEVMERMQRMPWNNSFVKPGQVIAHKADRYAAFLYDAVLLYAIALNETYAENLDVNDGHQVVKKMKGKAFSGMTGFVNVDKNGDRDSVYWMSDMDVTDGLFYVISQSDNEGLIPPQWPGGKNGVNNAPPDTPLCGFLGELCEIDELETWALTLIVIAVILSGCAAVGLGIFIHRRRKFEIGLLVQSWKINLDEIEVLKKGQRVQPATNDSSHDSHDEVATTSHGSRSTNMQSVLSLGTQQQLFCDAGFYRGQMVGLKDIRKEHIQLSRKIILELNEMKEMIHENLNFLVGACVEPGHIYVVWQYCPKGSLPDLLLNDDVKIDRDFKLSFMTDVVKGMEYLHKSHIHSHGNLKSYNCLIDSRWTVRIGDYGLSGFLSGQHALAEDIAFKKKLWTAPEILRENSPTGKGTQKGDVYSFGIIMFEVATRSEPYQFDKMTPRDAVNRIRNGEAIPFRPQLPDTIDLGKQVLEMIRVCWQENAEGRPSFRKIRTTLKKVSGGDINILDNILNMMEKYAYNLEEIVEERTQQVEEEKKKTDRLLYRMLPATVLEQLKAGKVVQPENYDQASIYFSDVLGFTALAADSSPIQIVDFLNDLYSAFDEIIAQHDVYKVETIGDAYMVASGVPVRNGDRHATEIASVALDLLSGSTHFKIRHRPHQRLQLRIGLHTGPVVGGVIGLMMPRYCLFGDTINTAARMQSTGKPQRIHISKQYHIALRELEFYEMTLRGEVTVKGKGLQQTYWLHGKKGYNKPLPVFES